MLSPLASTTVAAASDLGVQVTDSATGAILSGVAVCLGTKADTRQFGARLTDERGMVRFREVPKSPLKVTTSLSGYQAEVRDVETLYHDRVLIVKMATGWRKGPTCKSSASTAGTMGKLVITHLDLDVSQAARGIVRIETQVRGPAGQIRISQSPDFENVSWQAYQPSMKYNIGNSKGGKRLYVQVRRYANADGASLQSLSPVVSTAVNTFR